MGKEIGILPYLSKINITNFFPMGPLGRNWIYSIRWDEWVGKEIGLFILPYLSKINKTNFFPRGPLGRNWFHNLGNKIILPIWENITVSSPFFWRGDLYFSTPGRIFSSWGLIFLSFFNSPCRAYFSSRPKWTGRWKNIFPCIYNY